MAAIRKRSAAREIKEAAEEVVYIKIPTSTYELATKIAIREGATMAYILRKWIEIGVKKNAI